MLDTLLVLGLPLPRFSPADLRAASRSFGSTVGGFDGFHVCHHGMLCDEALEVLSLLYSMIEMIGKWPSQLCLVQVALLEKSVGGFRPIGLFASSYRVWGKARRCHLDA